MKPTHKQTHNLYKTIITWTLSFLILTMMELFLLVAVSLIPRSAIQQHTVESAEYFLQHPVFYRVADQNPSSMIDHYADAILINILYHYDADHPITSVLTASYYYTDTHNENENLYQAVTSNVSPTYDYFRYWHGSTVLIRPLLTCWNIRQIYILFAVLLVFLVAILFTLLFRRGYGACALAVVLSCCSISFWYIPMSLEYIWCFLIMLIAGICVIVLYQRNSEISGLFFLLVGNITAYFDFLTTETVTLIFPLSLVLILMYQNNRLHNIITGWKRILLYSVSWGIGYLSSWLAKWVIASIALQRNIFTEVFSSATTRVLGEAEHLHGLALSINALIRNVTCLFPFNHIPHYGYVVAICTLLICMMFYYLLRKAPASNIMPALFTILFLLPYLRYLFLANHSFLHYFFTYRAQFTSIFCLCMIFYYGTDLQILTKHFRLRKHHR